MDNYLTIIRKYLKDDCSSEEKEWLKQWINANEENKALFKKEIKESYAAKEHLEVDVEGAFERFVKGIQQKETKVISLKPVVRVIGYAAAVAAIIFGIYTYKSGNSSFEITTPEVVRADDTSSDKIKIVQADGTISYLGLDDTASIKDAEGNLVVKKNEDQLVIQGENHSTKTEYLQISIPKGKLFQLALSDGTKVWLNAASALKFPRHFNPEDKNRLVYLEGEGFFDVVTNTKQPFIVRTGEVDVEVLGTQFNVSSYDDDATIKTTLVEGSVAISDPEQEDVRLKLTPNYQAIFSKNNKALERKKVNPALFTSWMHKKIILQNESFAEVYKRIERTYDVEITSLNQKLNNTRFTGEFDIENVEQILKVFSETIAFTYVIKDKKITINP